MVFKLPTGRPKGFKRLHVSIHVKPDEEKEMRALIAELNAEQPTCPWTLHEYLACVCKVAMLQRIDQHRAARAIAPAGADQVALTKPS